MDKLTRERLIRLAEEEIPIHKYFGLKVETIEKEFIRVKVPFRKEFVGDIRNNRWHGGIMATIMNSVGGAIGVSNEMLYKIVEMAREKNLKILPLCPFANAMFKKLEDFKTLEK
jgi:hypothetical protein